MTMETIICPNCEGEGVTVKDKGFGHYSDFVKEDCSKCNGFGRLRRKTYNLQMPFGRAYSDFHAIDSKIFELIREFESGN